MTIADQIRQIRRVKGVADRAAVKAVPILTGTYTPTYFGSVTAGTTSYVIQQGGYVRVGNRLDITLTLQWSAATGTGNVRIGGLPYVSANVSNQNFAINVYSSGVTFANSGIVGLLTPNVSEIRLFSPISNVANTELSIEAAGTLVISGTYYVE